MKKFIITIKKIDLKIHYKSIKHKCTNAQQPLQRIWAFGLMESWFCIWNIWQIRRMGLI